MTQPPSLPSRTSAFAVASLCCGLLVFCCWPITAIPAIVCGHVAWSDIRRNANLQGKWMAVTGMSLGYLGLVISILLAVWLLMQASVFYQTMKELGKVASVDATKNPAFILPAPQHPDSSTNALPDPAKFMNMAVIGMLQPYTKAEPLVLPEKLDVTPPLKSMKVWLNGQNVMLQEDGANVPVQKSPEELDQAFILRIAQAVTASAGADDPNQAMLKKMLDQLQQLQPK